MRYYSSDETAVMIFGASSAIVERTLRRMLKMEPAAIGWKCKSRHILSPDGDTWPYQKVMGISMRLPTSAFDRHERCIRFSSCADRPHHGPRRDYRSYRTIRQINVNVLAVLEHPRAYFFFSVLEPMCF